ncbi:MAG: ERF family protein [Candidatus Binataceae bacterium]
MKEEAHYAGPKTKAILDHRDGHLCVLNESEVGESRARGPYGSNREWYAVREATEAEVATLIGRPVKHPEPDEGLYVDEEGTVYQLADKGETKPIAVERLPRREKTELETLLEASLKGGKEPEPNPDSKRVHRRIRNNGRKAKHALQVVSPAREAVSRETLSTEASTAAVDGGVSKLPIQLNLRQKLAEVRRRIGYVQKRGHNERFNYSYVTAADIAGAVGDLLAELGVVVIPRLENISYETAASRGEATRMARVVMAYTFADVDSGEQIVAKVAGQGLDPGDKAPYKAMTGALKYALLQSFLLATGDDPEEERADGRSSANPERRISADEIAILKSLIDETGTELERVLAYYKVGSLEEMSESTYRRALEVLNRKLAQRGNRETVHAQD